MNKDLVDFISHCQKYLDIFYKEHDGMRVLSDERNLLIPALMIRIAENFRGILSCVSAGVPINGYILLRSMVETYVIMGKNMVDVEFYKIYKDKFLKEEIKRINRQVKNGFYKGSSEEAKTQIAEYESQMSGLTATYNVAQLFVEIKKENIYEYFYVESNAHTHVDVYALGRYFNREGDNMKIGTNWNHLRDSVFTVSGAMDIFNDSYRHFKGFGGYKSNSFDNFLTDGNVIREKLNIKNL